MLYRPRWRGRLFGFETTFDMKQYILWLSGQWNELTLWGNIMHTVSVVAKSRRREYLHVPLHCPQEPAIPRRRADDEAKKSMFCTILLEYVTLVNVAALGGHSSLSIYLYTVPYMYM